MKKSLIFTQLKTSPRGQKAARQQVCHQSTGAMKQTHTPEESTRLSKESKTEKSSEESVEEILALFKPMLPCISPLSDLVRSPKYYMQMLLFSPGVKRCTE